MSAPDEEDRTVFSPGGSLPGGPARAGSAPGAGGARTSYTGFQTMAPRTDGNRVQIGDLLNNIFEVRRFIARGGMGEVFEGVNVNTDERVAIKVMLPSLSADPAIQDMFRKEARILQRLAHPALVPYRVLAQEPQLGTFYIVTDYIDGANLADVIHTIQPPPEELAALLRRLAEGLRAAHALGAIHRDISPDNVLLEDGRLDRARIIDFGIAKDTDPGSKTLIGDGFAGKLSYVAPEQLGDHGRDIGPWTDVYSLALVIRAIARKGQSDLGGSFVEAIDKRRKGVDLADVPVGLRPVLEAMLRPDPAERLRSMDAVLERLAAPAAVPLASRAAPAPKARPERAASAGPKPERTGLPVGYLAGGGAAAALLLAGVGYLAFGGGSSRPKVTTPVAATSAIPGGAIPGGGASARGASAAVAAALPGIACSWLTVEHETAAADGVTLAMSGVAGKPAEAQAAVGRAVASTGLNLASADFSDVAPLNESECSSVDAFRAIRAQDNAHLSVPQRKFEMSKFGPGTKYEGQIGARTIINLDIGNGVPGFAMYGLEPNGNISPVIPDKRTFDALPKTGLPIADLGGGKYRLSIDTNHSGWSGILLLTGSGGFSDVLVVGPAGSRGRDWPSRFAAAAAAGNWKAEMVWFKLVDEVPN